MSPLFTQSQYDKLIANGSDDNPNKDHPPVVRLFLTNTSMMWLISELDLEYPEIGFGLCDLGMGFPELGSVSITELEECQDFLHRIVRDDTFIGEHPMSVYANAARKVRRIVTDQASLASILNLKP